MDLHTLITHLAVCRDLARSYFSESHGVKVAGAVGLIPIVSRCSTLEDCECASYLMSNQKVIATIYEALFNKAEEDAGLDR